ncbi:MAG: alkaline phosphatase family protein [Candidatus Hermodarchaeota archaeon]
MVSKNKKVLLIGVDQAIPYLLNKYMDEGVLPNVRELVEGGVYTEAYSCPPCDTPTNWTTIATGATTADHGVTSFYLHVPGEPLDLGMQYRSRTQLSRNCTAEYFWDVADRSGLTPFVLNYPSGWPGNLRNGAMSLLVWPIPESLPRIIYSPIIQTFNNKTKDSNQKISKANSFPNKNLSYSQPLQITLRINNGLIKIPYELILHIVDINGKGYDSLYIPSNSKDRDQIIKKNEWSDWISIKINTAHGELPCLLKVKILDINEEGEKIKIQSSAVFNIKGWTKPDSLGEEIIRNVPIYEPPEVHEVEYLITGEIEPYLLYAREEATSIAEAIKFTKNHLGWNVCFFHIHFLDTVNHRTLGFLHKDSPLYSEASMEKANNSAKTAYMIMDELIGNLKSCIDDDTLVIFVSDHGAIPTWKNANLINVFIDAGLVEYKWDDSRKRFIIDWEKSKIFPYFEPPYIWVNLKGRDPQGIVNQSEYEKVRDDIINALSEIKDPDTGRHVIKVAYRKEDAESLGQNGERIGDIVYFMNPPYQIFDGNSAQLNAAVISRRMMNKPDIYNAKGMFGAHAYYLPNEKFGGFSISVPLIVNGPGIKEGVKLTDNVNLIDIAPTLSNFLGISKPKDSYGRILHEIFK